LLQLTNRVIVTSVRHRSRICRSVAAPADRLVDREHLSRGAAVQMERVAAVQTKMASVLKKKGHDIWWVSPDARVIEAVQLMAEKSVEALLVLENSRLVGIIAEKDCSRRVTLLGNDPKQMSVREVMTSPVIFVGPHHTVGDCMHIMTESRVTHLPVMAHDKVLGVVSIGDMVKTMLDEQDETIKHLEGYITGRYR
jgi:signal-transduction protein with cAMP-binding, CBS, and nucleotidyltransferase domain